MELLAYLQNSGQSMTAFASSVGVNQSTISRIANGVTLPDPELAVKIVVETQGEVTLDEMYGTPKKWWASRRKV